MYTIVQHSAYAYAGKNSFAKGVETRAVESKTDIEKVKKVGGKLFDKYMEAEDYGFSEMYPSGSLGIYPHVRGTFARSKIDQLRIYVPAS